MDQSRAPIRDVSRDAEIRTHLEKVLSDFATSGASRRSRLLRYLVESTLDDRTGSLKESVIAAEVFDRPPDYDPQIDSVVRVEIGRLRARLAEYYEKTGGGDPVKIEIPRGGYRPVFIFRESDSEPAAVPAKENNRSWAIAIAAVLIVAAAALIAVWRMRVPGPSTPATIAVLPFLNLSGDPSNEYLADGISEELTEALAEFNDLRVVARTSAFQYKGKSGDVREIGKNLRAAAVLEGSIARREGQLRVIAQLIRTSDGYHLWSHTYEANLADLPAVESGIAETARERLAPSSLNSGANPAPEIAMARNAEAHDLYMRAVYEFNQRTEASTRRSMDLAREASEKDPSFAAPYVVMAAAESQLVQFEAERPRDAEERAWQDVGKALSLDPNNRSAHAQKALLAYTNQWDWPQAESEFKLALAGGSHG
jgi:serine/threonine-protein kinase